MLDELRQFLLVVEQGTFTAAAKRAHLTQPALTAAMHRLEQAFGARLLHRARTGATPTAAGEALVPRARAVLAAYVDGQRAVAEVAGLHAGVVRIGAGPTACTYLLPKILAELRRRHPQVRFLLREAMPEEVENEIETGDLDLGIITSERGEPWRDDPLVLVAAPGVDAKRAPFVTFPRGSTTRTLLDHHFPGVEIVMELGSIAAVKGNVRAGIGVALISKSAIETDVSLGRLRVVSHPKTPIARTFSIVSRGIDRLPPAAAMLREMLLASAQVPRKRRRR